MILTFSDERFPELIKNRVKINTYRKDLNNRWKQGNKIEFWLHNPRNVDLHPYQFANGLMLSVDRALILPSRNIIQIEENIYRAKSDLDELAIKDGFENWEHMKTWFTEDFNGKRLTWSQKTLNFWNQNKRGKFYPKTNQEKLF